MKIFINSGHMVGVDSGAINKIYNTTEASIVLEIGNYLKEILTERGHDVMLEQSNNIKGEGGQDWYDSICYHANDWDADICVSLHANAANTIASGTECWYISYKGHVLAQNIQDRLVELLGLYDRGARFSSDYWILRYTDMPCVIVETAFIDNNDDCYKLMTMKKEIAESIADGIDDYFVNN